MRRTAIGWVTGAWLLWLAAAAGADGPAPPPPAVPTSAERHFQEGLDAQKKDWRQAAQAYEAVVEQREAFPEPWKC